MKTYIRTNFQNCKALAIIVGNIKRYQAINVAKQFFRKLHLNGPYRDNSSYLRRTVQFSAPSNYLVQVPASYSQENAILVIYQIGRLSLRDKLKFSVINSITRDECFHQLRTIRQLGYSVRCSMIEDPGGIGSYVVLIQSINSTQVLLESINEYIDHTKFYLRNISEQVVQGKINQTIEQVSQTSPSLSVQMSHWWMLIKKDEKDIDFEPEKKKIEILKELTKEDLVKTYENTIGSQQTSRFVIVAYGRQYFQQNNIQIGDVNSINEDYSYFGPGLQLLNDPYDFIKLSHLYPAASLNP